MSGARYSNVKKIATKFRVATLMILLVFCCTMGTACSSSLGSQDGDAQQQTAEATAKGVLAFTVDKGDWASSAEQVVVSITGKGSDGTVVDEDFKATIGKTYSLDYGAGDYTFALSAESQNVEDVIYKGSSSVSFDGEIDKSIAIRIEKDSESMAAVAAAKAEAEAKVKAEAEAKAKAEQEAAAQRVADEQAAAAAAVAASQAQSSSDGGETTVYITNTGEKYHMSGCQYLRKSKIAIGLGNAQAQGYTACSKCNPPR